MKIVVDTNIVISAIISDKGKIGEILLNKPEGIQFLSPEFLLQELTKHKEKVKSLTGLVKRNFHMYNFFLQKTLNSLSRKKSKASIGNGPFKC